ncbi:MAG: hypothetical protein UW88_C0030G0004 [Candidatus Collierbacteria bacterium GW2011_GWD2_45_10]|nr:MAG: hypothetical protein UW88_C0030G0004 [Candidatus Collierbacteria bacterium GW2011_GWD2_45_10]
MPIPVFPTNYTTAGLPSTTGTDHRLPNPSRPLSEAIKVPSITFQADSGHTQRRKKSNPIRVWDCNYPALYANQAQAIETFFLQMYGSVTSFDWWHPVSKSKFHVRFQSDTLEKKYIEHGPKGPIYTLSFKLEQTW